MNLYLLLFIGIHFLRASTAGDGDNQDKVDEFSREGVSNDPLDMTVAQQNNQSSDSVETYVVSTNSEEAKPAAPKDVLKATVRTFKRGDEPFDEHFDDDENEFSQRDNSNTIPSVYRNVQQNLPMLPESITSLITKLLPGVVFVRSQEMVDGVPKSTLTVSMLPNSLEYSMPPDAMPYGNMRENGFLPPGTIPFNHMHSRTPNAMPYVGVYGPPRYPIPNNQIYGSMANTMPYDTSPIHYNNIRGMSPNTMPFNNFYGMQSKTMPYNNIHDVPLNIKGVPSNSMPYNNIYSKSPNAIPYNYNMYGTSPTKTAHNTKIPSIMANSYKRSSPPNVKQQHMNDDFVQDKTDNMPYSMSSDEIANDQISQNSRYGNTQDLSKYYGQDLYTPNDNYHNDMYPGYEMDDMRYRMTQSSSDNMWNGMTTSLMEDLMSGMLQKPNGKTIKMLKGGPAQTFSPNAPNHLKIDLEM